MMIRYIFPALLILSGILASAQAAEKPNFLILLCDDLGYGDLGCYGHPAIRTPNLDRLAAQGIRFTDCYSAAPVCSPSRAGLLTGRSPSRMGVYDWIPTGHAMHMGRQERTIARQLQEAGYATALSGKWHCNGKFNSPEQPQPADHGFDHWFATQNNAGPSHENPVNFVRNGQKAGPLQGFSAQIVADEAIGWMRKQAEAGKPFFQFVAFHETHEPVASPKELVESYRAVAKNEDQAQYFANVTNMDTAVGRLLAALDEMNVAGNTLVFFSSDNGPETLNRYAKANRSYGSPGDLRGMKLWLYDGGIRVPGLLRWPGVVKPEQVITEPVCSLDLMPTFCELAGVEAPKDRVLDGTSLAPLLRGGELQREKGLYWHYYRAFPKAKAALREGDWMILGRWNGPDLSPGSSVQPADSQIIKTHQLNGFELYNLRSDPGQKQDLAGAEADRLKQMSERLIARYREVQAEGPVWEPDPKLKAKGHDDVPPLPRP